MIDVTATESKMRRRPALPPLLLLLPLAACGLDDFSWGDDPPPAYSCEQDAIAWKMHVAGPVGAERIDPEVNDVERIAPGTIHWSARYSAEVNPRFTIRDYVFERAQLYTLIEGADARSVLVESAPCELAEEKSHLRDTPLESYRCDLLGVWRGEPLHIELTLAEQEVCTDR